MNFTKLFQSKEKMIYQIMIFQAAVKSFVNDVDKNHLRTLEKDMHLCAAKCCDTTTSSIEDVHRCVERCQDSTMRAQQFVQAISHTLKQLKLRMNLMLYDVTDSSKQSLNLLAR
jgi:hypothetical protein